MQSIFSQFGGLKGLSNTLFSGVNGSAHKVVGVDFRSQPGIITAHQKLSKHSGTTITELCKNVVNVSDGSKLWFSSESGKIWREVSGTYSLVHTLSKDDFDIDNFPLVDYVDFSSSVRTMFFTARLEPETAGVHIEPTADASATGEGSSNSISLDIDIPDEPNQIVVVLGGTYTQYVQDNITSATVGGNSASYLSTASIGTEFFIPSVVGFSGKQFTYLNPTAGTNTVTVNFSSSYAHRFLAVLVFKNVHQTTPINHAWRVEGNAGVVSQFTDTKTYNIYGQIAYTFVITPPATHEVTADNNFLIRTFTNPTINARITASYVKGFNNALYEEDVVCLGAEEHIGFADENDEEGEQTVYFATQSFLWKVPVTDIDDFATIESVGQFSKEHTTHPMIKQNLQLFIGDGNKMASVSDLGVFTSETNFSLPKGEEIVTLERFDTDLLVGTKDYGFGRTLRWDTVSQSWSTDDEIFVKGGVSAFLKDDNYVFVLDEEGYVWFYNGERNELMFRIPELANGKVKINPNAVGYFRGVPVFGLSNGDGNTVLQGVYGLGKYSKGYPTSMSLDFPMSSGEFDGVEIGAIVIDGRDMYVSWKDGEDVGVAKLDYTAKYTGAYIDTMVLSDPKTRHQLKSLTDVQVPYFSIPTDTAVAVSYKRGYESSFTSVPTRKDSKRLVVYNASQIPEIANLQLKIVLTVDGNNAPQIEDVLYNLAPISKK